MSAMLDRMRGALGSGRLIPEGSKVLVALSGGADSAALLHGLLQLRSELGIEVCAAHLNHGIRAGTADRDEEFCERLCGGYGVEFTSGRVDCPRLAQEMKLSMEEAARNARYEFLNRAADELGASRIATAHHADDQAETVLLNLFRGTGTAGLRAMPQLRGRIVRPLLSATRQDILDHIAEYGLEYVHDETNEDTKYARNRLRSLDAELRLINPSYARNVCRAAELLADDDDALCAIAAEKLNAARKNGGAECAVLEALPNALRSRTLRMLAGEAGLSHDLGAKHVAAMTALLSADTGAAADLPNGYTARVSYGVISVSRRRAEEHIADYCVPLKLEGETDTPMGRIEAWRVKRPADLSDGAPFACFVPESAAEGAVVRGRRPGDVIHPLGARGSKKLKDFYIDKKIDRADRLLPLVAKENDVMWAIGAGISEKAAVRGEEHVVWLRFVPR